MDEWIEIVSSTDRIEAAELFKKWKENNTLWSNSLSDDDIRIDSIRTLDKRTLTRYRVRKISNND